MKSKKPAKSLSGKLRASIMPIIQRVDDKASAKENFAQPNRPVGRKKLLIQYSISFNDTSLRTNRRLYGHI